MMLIRAIIQPTKLSAVRGALEDAGYADFAVSDALGYGRQHGQTAMFRGQEYRIDLLRKIAIEVVVEDDDLDRVVATIVMTARLGSVGQIGDGKIFVLPVAREISI